MVNDGEDIVENDEDGEVLLYAASIIFDTTRDATNVVFVLLFIDHAKFFPYSISFSDGAARTSNTKGGGTVKHVAANTAGILAISNDHIQEEEKEKQAEIKAHIMENDLQNLICKQFQEQYEKMTMIVNDKLKQMECHVLKTKCREEERAKQEQERERQAQIKAHAMENKFQNMISKRF
nr:hypothetical protein [Tanacetum cinerariifolium]